MSTVPSSRQNPDEFHGLHAQDPTNIERGQQAANQQPPQAGQTGQPTTGHTNAPNYGDFGKPENAGEFQPRYGQETPPEPDQTHHGDDRFRHSGTLNWETDEPANPHHGPEQ